MMTVIQIGVFVTTDASAGSTFYHRVRAKLHDVLPNMDSRSYQ
jgi:hypothetical protein